MMSRFRLLVLIVGVAVPALFVALVLYARYFTEGWGALGLAPLVLPLLVASAAVAVVGALLYVARVRTRPHDLPVIAVVSLNALLLWYANARH